jgi:hypothetical protein
MFDREVKIGDGFGAVLCFRVPTALRVGPFDLMGTGFYVCAAEMDEEGRRYLRL